MTALVCGSLTIAVTIGSSVDMPVVGQTIGQTIKLEKINLPRPNKSTAILPQAIATKLGQSWRGALELLKLTAVEDF